MKGDAPFAPRGPVLAAGHHVGRGRRPPNPTLLARNAYIGMIETAQNVADRYKLTREEIDAFALRSQQHAKAARDSATGQRDYARADFGDEEDAGTHVRA